MERDADHWQARLPDNLHTHVVWPVKFEAHHDDSVPASKWKGFDALGLLCWYRHRFTQWDAAFDDDLPSMQLLREEDFEAWRTLGGSWVRRVQRVAGAAGEGEGERGVLTDSGFEIVPARAIPRL